MEKSKIYNNLIICLSFFITSFFVSTANSHPKSDDIANLVEKLSPAVVNVFTTQEVKKQNSDAFPFDNIPPQFRDFFKNLPPGIGPGMPPSGPRNRQQSHLPVPSPPTFATRGRGRRDGSSRYRTQPRSLQDRSSVTREAEKRVASV